MSENPSADTTTEASVSNTEASGGSQTAPKQASAARLRALGNLIKDSISQIDHLDVIAKDYKDKISAPLKDAEASTHRVADIYENVEAVTEEIIKPVKEAINETGAASTRAIDRAIERIKGADRIARILGSIAVVLGVLALVPLVPEWYSRVKNFIHSSRPESSSPSARDIRVMLDTEIPPPPPPIDRNKFPTVTAIENLVANRRSEANSYSQCASVVKNALPPDAGSIELQLQAQAAEMYSLMVCAGLSRDWKKVADFATRWGARNPSDTQSKDLRKASYGFAIRAYDAEALVKTGPLNEAVTQYQSLQTEAADANGPSFLSPVDFRLTDSKSLVAHRLADLEPLSGIGDSKIEIYDYQSGKRATELADIFNDNGLNHSHPNNDPWPSPYRQVEVFYKKRPSQPAAKRLKELVSSEHYTKMELVPASNYKNPRSGKPDISLSEKLGPKSNVDLVIVLP